MALHFQPPPERKSGFDRINTSLDDIFNAYERAKAGAQAEADRRGNDILNYGFDRRQVTPEIMAAASQPQIATNPNVPEGAFGTGSPAMPSTEHPIIGSIRSFIEKRNKSQQGAADLQQSQINENNAKAWALMNPRTAPQGGGAKVVNIKGVDFIETTGPNGAPHYQPIPPREPSQSENAARQYADAATQAHQGLSELENSGYQPSKVGNMIEGVLPTFAQDANFQKLDQSRRQFINAILRRESGAAISASEYDNYTRQYFPVPGDSPEVRRQKAESRALKIRGLSEEGKRVGSQLPAGNVKKVGRFTVEEG